MKLSEVFYQLSVGELSQIKLGGDGSGVIPVDAYPKLIASINLGLIALYKRFMLKEGELTLALQPGQSVYALNSKYGVSSSSTASPKYILDSGFPFKNDIIKVESVTRNINHPAFQEYTIYMPSYHRRHQNRYDPVLPLNNRGNDMSCFTPNKLTLKVPEILLPTVAIEDKRYNLVVTYRANVVLIPNDPTDVVDPEEAEVDIPYEFLEPLLYFVASRLGTPDTNNQQDYPLGTVYGQKYELACQELERYDLRIDQGGQYNRNYQNGWV